MCGFDEKLSKIFLRALRVFSRTDEDCRQEGAADPSVHGEEGLVHAGKVARPNEGMLVGEQGDHGGDECEVGPM